MRLGYNTNGLAHHDPLAAIELLAELGYQSVAITLDHQWLNPYSLALPEQVVAIRRALVRFGLRSVIETGARFLLDPRKKHEPTLMSSDAAGRTRRVEFLIRALNIARELESDGVSIWSGKLHEPSDADPAYDRLVAGLSRVLEAAERLEVPIGFEPEPGMFIDTMSRFEGLLSRIDSPQLKLTLDVGHLHCQGEFPIADHVRRHADRLVNVHIEDMKAGVHEHLMFGEGEIDFPPIAGALSDVGYSGGVHVELSRHSHMAPEAAGRAIEFLRTIFGPHG